MTMLQPGKVQVSVLSEREILITRFFAAPRPLVWDCMTKPELLKRWLGPAHWKLEVCEIDARVGGKYRYLWRGEKGEMGMSGTCLELEPPHRIVNTERFDDAWYPGEAVATLVLTEEGAGTRLNLTVRYETQEGRDAAIASGMTEGMDATYGRLDEYLAAVVA